MYLAFSVYLHVSMAAVPGHHHLKLNNLHLVFYLMQICHMCADPTVYLPVKYPPLNDPTIRVETST